MSTFNLTELPCEHHCAVQSSHPPIATFATLGGGRTVSEPLDRRVMLSAVSPWHWYEVAPPVLLSRNPRPISFSTDLNLSANTSRAADGTAVIWARSPADAVREAVDGTVTVTPSRHGSAGTETAARAYNFVGGVALIADTRRVPFALATSHAGQVVRIALDPRYGTADDTGGGRRLRWSAEVIRVDAPPATDTAAWATADAAAVKPPSIVDPFDVKVTDAVYLGMSSHVTEGTDTDFTVTVDRECHDADTYDTALSVAIDWSASTAVQGVDYTGSLPTSVSWASGVYGTQTFEVPLVNDTVPEWTKTFVGEFSDLPPNVIDGDTTDGSPAPQTCDLDDDDLNLSLASTNLSNDPGPLTALKLGYAPNAPYHAAVTLSAPTTGPGAVSVWSTPTPGPNDVPLLAGQTSSITWTFGSGTTPPTTVYVKPESGSQSVGDVVLGLAASDVNSTPVLAFPTSTQATTKPATNVIVHLTFGGNVVDDIKAGDRLIGQDIAATATVQSPYPNPTYAWTADGKSYKDYTLGSAPSDPVLTPLAQSDLNQSNIDLFWTDPGQKNLSCIVTVNGGSHTRKTFFNIEKPTSTLNTQTAGSIAVGQTANADGSAGDWSEFVGPNSPALTATGSVQQPTGFAQGTWAFLQVVTSFDHIHGGGKSYYDFDNSSPYLDTSFPLPGANMIGSGGNSLIPTDRLSYSFIDYPNSDLSKTYTISNLKGDGTSGENADTVIDGLTRSDSYDLYMMYLPPGASSRWVPLKKVHWSWAADASVVAHTPTGAFVWGLNSSSGPTAGAVADITDPPVGWNGVWQGVNWLQGS